MLIYSKFLYTWNNSFLYDDCLLTDTIVIWEIQELSFQFIEQLTLVKWHSFQVRVGLNHAIGTITS